MIRPYLHGFNIAFNVSEPSTWMPYVNSMHDFLQGKLVGALKKAQSLYNFVLVAFMLPFINSKKPSRHWATWMRWCPTHTSRNLNWCRSLSDICKRADVIKALGDDNEHVQVRKCGGGGGGMPLSNDFSCNILQCTSAASSEWNEPGRSLLLLPAFSFTSKFSVLLFTPAMASC